jgi:penicillin-binding protein 2
MFERRLKIFLMMLVLLTLVLVARAFQVQVVNRQYWRDRADDYMRRPLTLETTRGRILDYRGREVAVERAAIDASVDYRAIPKEPNAAWVKTLAINSVLKRFGDGYRKSEKSKRIEMLAAEVVYVKEQIDRMWLTLAQRHALTSGKSLAQSREEVDEIRQGILQRVEVRRRYLWYRRYELAMERMQTSEPASWYQQWLIDESSRVPKIDSFEEELREETQPHPILRGIDSETNNFLGKNLKDMPGLVLEPSTQRFYPYRDIAAHLLGNLTRVSGDDLKVDPFAGDELKQYLPNDLIGRMGIEALCERTLRGKRGQLETFRGNDSVIKRTDPVPGDNVQITIDMELQADIQRAFRDVEIEISKDNRKSVDMHGAAVVIDVTPQNAGEVRALVSNPTFDLNEFNAIHASLLVDDVNLPLLNRATQSTLEGGSTLKPVVGIGAITQGVWKVDEGIECTGYFRNNKGRFRCWTASKFEKAYPTLVAHHQIPWSDPHPTGFLLFPDALQRSCNVVFETLADRLGRTGLTYWFDQFGLGRPTGIGISERSGMLPGDAPGAEHSGDVWIAGIGQGPILVTPLQMANVAATIATDGIWHRPRLLMNGSQMNPDKLPKRFDKPIPDQVNLKLSPEALAAAREGMYRVVNTNAGTGNNVLNEYDENGRLLRHENNYLFGMIAAKTGTAQASKFSVRLRDEAGEYLKDEKGKFQRKVFEPNDPELPWYIGFGEQGTDVKHAWFIGFAPAKNPQVAFAVMVEYGGSGGAAAANVARQVIEACVEHGYLSLGK